MNESIYKTDMTLRIKSIGPNDFGSYKCIAKNSLGETDSTIKLYSKCSFFSKSIKLTNTTGFALFIISRIEKKKRTKKNNQFIFAHFI